MAVSPYRQGPSRRSKQLSLSINTSSYCLAYLPTASLRWLNDRPLEPQTAHRFNLIYQALRLLAVTATVCPASDVVSPGSEEQTTYRRRAATFAPFDTTRRRKPVPHSSQALFIGAVSFSDPASVSGPSSLTATCSYPSPSRWVMRCSEPRFLPSFKSASTFHLHFFS